MKMMPTNQKWRLGEEQRIERTGDRVDRERVEACCKAKTVLLECWTCLLSYLEVWMQLLGKK